jgi:hypothetical protein
VPHQYLLAQEYYNDKYTDFIESGFLTESEVLKILKDKNTWTSDHEIRLTDLYENLLKLKRKLPSLTFQSQEKKQVILYIEATNKEINKLNKIKNSLMNNTVEYLSKIEKYKYFIYLLTKDEHYNKVWNSLHEFNTTDEKLILKLMHKTYFDDTINESVIRELARTEPWRSVWLGSCKTGNLFNKSMVDMTDLQRILVSWSLIYDSVYEHSEPPSGDVIDTDVLLDAWLEDQNSKRKSKENNSNFIKNEKIKNASEIGIIVDSPEDAKKVFDLNDDTGKQTIMQRINFAKEKGSVKDTDQPDIKQDIQMQINNLIMKRNIK